MCKRAPVSKSRAPDPLRSLFDGKRSGLEPEPLPYGRNQPGLIHGISAKASERLICFNGVSKIAILDLAQPTVFPTAPRMLRPTLAS
jgi:hypothetical protein